MDIDSTAAAISRAKLFPQDAVTLINAITSALNGKHIPEINKAAEDLDNVSDWLNKHFPEDE